jgi:adenylosuccinate lyase
MEKRDIFLNLSPLDHRYYLANRELFERLSRYLSEEAGIRYSIRIEVALLMALIEQTGDGAVSADKMKTLENLPDRISPEEVYREENRTRHNIRALVNVLKDKVPRQYRHLVHLGATSADIQETSAALRIRDVVRKVLLPFTIELELKLTELALAEAGTPQVARTHGQHAVPITFGYAVAEYVARLGKSIERMEIKSRNLRGKLSGAVGAYNAISLIVTNPEELEKKFLSRLGIMPSEHATQIVEPEYLLELLLEINMAFGILANLADDLRSLQRTEIGEVREHFSSTQVGSSTMPQKRNPWNSEHVKSLWKAFSPRVLTFFMDQISEHQRDLSNSASSRFVADYLAGYAAAVNRMTGVIASLRVEKERMEYNLKSMGDMILAEAVYILLSMAGETDAHEQVRKLTLESEQSAKSFSDVIRSHPDLYEKLSSIRQAPSIDTLFSNPEKYSGLAAEKAEKLARKYEKRMKEIMSLLEEE